MLEFSGRGSNMNVQSGRPTNLERSTRLHDCYLKSITGKVNTNDVGPNSAENYQDTQ